MTVTPEQSEPAGEVRVADDTATASAVLADLRRGTTVLWRGDFHNGRQLLQAVGRRIDRSAARQASKDTAKVSAADLFLRQRSQRSRRARLLAGLVVDIEVRATQWFLDLRRAPDIAAACAHAWGPAPMDATETKRRVPFTELQGVLSAWQWHQSGVEIAALGEKIYPDYGVFSPTRSEYVDLVDAVAANHLATGATVWDLGTGTGVLAAIMSRRGAGQVIAADVSPRAVDCARRNLDQLGVGAKTTVVEADLWPENATGIAPESASVADVIVFNPPWLPGTPSSDLERGIYDADSVALHGFLSGLAAHLSDAGEGWLVLSNLAELLGLRQRDQLEQWINDGGLQVVDRQGTHPRHPRAQREDDPLHSARSREVTSLWRLTRK